MSFSRIFVFVAATVVILVPAAVCGNRLSRAEADLEAAQSLFAKTASEVQEILELRSKQERIGLAERPTQDVIAQVNAVLAQVGIPTNRLKNLAPEADTVVNAGQVQQGVQYRRQSLRLTLEDLGVSEIGALLAAWTKSSAGAIWRPNRIELTHNRSGTNSNRYDLSLLISAVYVAQAREDK